MRRRYLAFSAFIVLVLAAGAAQAQGIGVQAPVYGGTPAVPTGTQTKGFRLTDGLYLHLGLGITAGWDSNVFYERSNTHSSFFLKLTPGFDLTNRPRVGNRQIEFDLNAALGYVEFLTGDKQISSHRQFNVIAGMKAAFFTMSPYNFVIYDNYLRLSQPLYTIGSPNVDRDMNQLGIRANLSPGGGRLTINAGYMFGIDYFERQLLRGFNLQSHTFNVRASWRFLPKTSVYVDATESLHFYQGDKNAFNRVDSYPLRVTAGLQGLITTRLAANLYAGYGNGFYTSGASPNTGIGGLSLTWKPSILSTGLLGYEHDFVNSLLGAYYDIDRVYLGWTQLIWRFTGFIGGAYSNQRYKGIVGTAQGEFNPNRVDNYITGSVRADYPFQEWLIGSVGYDVQANLSNSDLRVGLAGITPVNYTKHVVYLRLNVAY